MTLARLDRWAGKTLFHPPIIKLCQISGWSQYRVASGAYMIDYMLLLYRSMTERNTWALQFMVGLCCLVFTIFHAVAPERKDRSFPFWRIAGLLFLAMNVVSLTALGSAFWLLLLIAEYARTIDTIPPTKIKERGRKLAEKSA